MPDQLKFASYTPVHVDLSYLHFGVKDGK
jgi:hypothetical protein